MWLRQQKCFSLVNTLCGTPKCNPLSEDSGSLADDFADFFMGKIKKIRDQLENHPKYAPEAGLTKACFDKFIPLEEDEIRTIIGSMPSKSCELDPIPTNLFKKILPVLLQTITVIVTTSLKKEEFNTRLENSYHMTFN